jgi:hypothetical protein
MQFKTSMTMLASAVALALSSHVLAQNAAGDGDIYISIDDLTSSTEFLYDTGVSASTFSNTSSWSVDLSSANPTGFSSFLGSLKSGTTLGNTSDQIQYSVFAGTGASGNLNSYQTLFTSASPVTTTSTGNNIGDAWGELNELLGGNYGGTITSLTFTGSEYVPSTNPGGQWYGAGHETNFDDDLVVENAAAYGTAMDFYTESTVKPTSSKVGSGSESQISGDWLLSSSSNGDAVLAFAPVPLPAPLLLLVSGLGMMGVLGRRRANAAKDAA